MAGSRLAATLGLFLLLCWSTYQSDAQALTVEITVDRTDPPGFTPGDSTEYRAASGPQVITCTATGGSGSEPTYQWSSDCRDCPFQVSTSGTIFIGVVHSGDTGTHTCTATRGGDSVEASITFNIVGYGIHIIRGTSTVTATEDAGSLPNNGLVIATTGPSTFLHFSCRSDSMTENVGEIIGLDDMAINSDVRFQITNPLPGEISVINTAAQGPLQNQEQGVYTCRIPDSTNTIRSINVGIYIPGFNTIPSITNPLVFTPGSSSSTLTCTSTGSVAATVTFTRDGTTVGPLRNGESTEFGGITYQLTQTVTGRAQSTYQNVLIINQTFANIAGSTFTCSVGNTIGTSPNSESLQIMEPATAPRNVIATAESSTEITVTWEEVLAIDENSIIIYYEVQFEPLEFTETLTTSSVNTTGLTVIISSLQEYVEYDISVRAYTSVGPGPYSDPVTERTLEDRPATPPQNVQAIARSSTEIMVTWDVVLPIDQNGIITIYEVQYEPLQFVESLSAKVTITIDMTVNLRNLQEYVEYNISVRAYTSIGFGPFSTEITERTFEDEFGFCDYEVSITSRGNYTWPETTGGNEVELECQLGPAVGVAPDEAIGRRRCNTSGEWEDPQLENCITMVALQLQQLEEALNNAELTEENVGEVNQDLREVIDEAGEEDQTVENLQVVASVFATTAALLSNPTIRVEEDVSEHLISLSNIVNNIVEVLDTIQVWPEEVVEDMGSDIVEAFEEIVTSLVELENFTNLTFVGDDLIFTAESVETEILVVAGRGFSSSRDENGTLGTASGNVGGEEELLAPEEIATALLSPSLFEQFESDAGSGEVGFFFALYESSSLFPIARESDTPTTAESENDGGIMSQVGSPVVAATVSAGGRTEFPNLTDPVIVVLRLNPVLDGNITRRTCVSYDFNLADGIGNWTSEGCKTIVSEDDPNIVTCSCNHLTNFACLVDICTRTEGCELTSTASIVLEVLSIIGVVLSLVGIVLTITTLLIFKKLRQRDVTKFHIQLCIAISGMLLVFVIGIDRVPPKDLYGGCVAVSATIHYFTLAAVMWMGAGALLMFQKVAFVFIQITTKYIIIISIVCWVVPIVPVVIALGIDRDFMVNRDSANDVTFCFIGDRRVFFGAFLGPILAILLFNLVMMVLVVTVLVRHMRNAMGRTKEQMKQKTALRLLISITGIMSLFGLTWIFGALTISGASLPFQILFVVFNGFQGFFIFLFLCVLSKDTRELWKESLSCGHYKSSTIHQATGKFSSGGTKKPKAAAGTVTVALSVRKSEQPMLSVASDHEVSKNPHVSKDQVPTLGGDSSTFGHSNKRKEGGDIIRIRIENPQATDSLELQPGEVQSPTLGSSKQVGAESSSEEIWGANAKINDNPTTTITHGLSQCGHV